MKKFLIILMAVFTLILFMDKGYVHADWNGNMTVGANMSSGNTDNAGINISGKAVQRVDNERYTGQIKFNYAEEAEQLTVRNSYGSFKFDSFITDQTYGLLKVELRKDEFNNLNLETIIGPGVGYQVSDNLAFEAGLAYFSKDVTIGEDSQWLTARLGMNYLRDITDTIRFEDALTVNPSLRESGEYTLRNEADFIYMFSNEWSGKITHTIQYDSEPSVNVRKRDTALIAGLQYNF